LSLVGHELVEFLFKRYPAADLSIEVNDNLDTLGQDFAELAHLIAYISAVTPEQTLALRALHDAHRAAIFAVVSHARKSD
jgi:hypothetical protein